MSFSLCGSVGANTGAIKCDRRRGIPKKIIVSGADYDSTDYASESAFEAAFKADFLLATGTAAKNYPFPEITGVTDKTDANKESTLGAFGPKVTLIEGKPGYEFDVIAGTTLEKQLRKFNGQQVPIFIFDDAGAVWGKLDANANFAGTDVLIFTTPHKFGDGANGQTTKVSISFVSSSDLYDSAAFVETSFSLSDLEGLVDATLSESSSHATNVYHIQAKIKVNGLGQDINIGTTFGAALANTALWTAFTGATFGTALAMTSIAYASGVYTVAFDSTAFTALSSGAKIKLNLADPATLDAADVTGVEGIAVIVTK